jgi:hypothetical protein
VSRTHRRHEAPGKAKKRGPKNKASDDAMKPVLKTNKQRRKGDRQSLRKEWI